jgi:hypothetical protein
MSIKMVFNDTPDFDGWDDVTPIGVMVDSTEFVERDQERVRSKTSMPPPRKPKVPHPPIRPMLRSELMLKVLFEGVDPSIYRS